MAPLRQKAPLDPEKELIIKVKACQRLMKEADYYKREVVENEAKLEKMKVEGKDVHDVKKFEEVLGESHMMVPDSERRLKETLEDLNLFLDTNTSLQESETMTLARTLLLQQIPKEPSEHVTHVDDGVDEF